jgi:hypothetical protein
MGAMLTVFCGGIALPIGIAAMRDGEFVLGSGFCFLAGLLFAIGAHAAGVLQ